MKNNFEIWFSKHAKTLYKLWLGFCAETGYVITNQNRDKNFAKFCEQMFLECVHN